MISPPTRNPRRLVDRCVCWGGGDDIEGCTFFSKSRLASEFLGETPMAKWLRPLVLTLYIARHLTTVGSSLARVTCETSHVLLVDGRGEGRGVSWISRFRLTFRLARLKMSEIILAGRKTQIKKNQNLFKVIEQRQV